MLQLIIAKSSFKDFKIYENQKKISSCLNDDNDSQGILKKKKNVKNDSRKTVRINCITYYHIKYIMYAYYKLKTIIII